MRQMTPQSGFVFWTSKFILFFRQMAQQER